MKRLFCSGINLNIRSSYASIFSTTLFPRQPMIPRLMQQILKWPICWTSSFLTHIVTKIPTICLLAIRLYFIWLVVGMELSKISNPLAPSSSSSEDMSPSLILDCWHRKQKSLLGFLSNSEVQLQVFSLLPFSVLKVLLIFLREGLAKNSDPPRLVVRLETILCGLFSDWLIRASHFAAGSLSSTTSTFPAFRGTISWNLRGQTDKHPR